MVEGKLHPLVEQSRLQSVASQLRHSGRAAEQRNSLEHAQHAGCSGHAVNLSKKAWTVLARRTNRTELEQSLHELGMLVRPAPCAGLGPKRGFFRANHAHANRPQIYFRRPLNRPIENAGDFARPVVARAKQVERRRPGKGAYLMHYGRSEAEKECLNSIKRGRAQFLKDAEAEGLSARGIDAVKDREGTVQFHPRGAGGGKQTTPGVGNLNARMTFGALQTARKCEI